jgi:hypothetical protein
MFVTMALMACSSASADMLTFKRNFQQKYYTKRFQRLKLHTLIPSGETVTLHSAYQGVKMKYLHVLGWVCLASTIAASTAQARDIQSVQSPESVLRADAIKECQLIPSVIVGTGRENN